MPPSPEITTNDDILMVIAYLRKLGAVPPGDAREATSRTARACSPLNARAAIASPAAAAGSVPDLTRIGMARSRAALVREIRAPSEWVPPAFETVTLVTKDGQRIRGVKKNEDVFSIQVMDTRERIQGYLKAEPAGSDLREGIADAGVRPGRLNDSDLDDLVGYLSTLRGADAGGPLRTSHEALCARLLMIA